MTRAAFWVEQFNYAAQINDPATQCRTPQELSVASGKWADLAVREYDKRFPAS